jgi:hypothetical protein
VVLRPTGSRFGRSPTELGFATTIGRCFPFCSSGQTMVHSSEKGTQWTSDLQDLQTPNGQTMLPEMAKRSFKSHVQEEPGKQKTRSCRAQELARSSAQENERQKKCAN